MSITRRSFVVGALTAPVALRFIPKHMPTLNSGVGARIGAAVGAAVGAAIASSIMDAQAALARYIESLPVIPSMPPEQLAAARAAWAEVEAEEERQRSLRYF